MHLGRQPVDSFFLSLKK